jgi:hypothetical protein
MIKLYPAFLIIANLNGSIVKSKYLLVQLKQENEEPPVPEVEEKNDVPACLIKNGYPIECALYIKNSNATAESCSEWYIKNPQIGRRLLNECVPPRTPYRTSCAPCVACGIAGPLFGPMCIAACLCESCNQC